MILQTALCNKQNEQQQQKVINLTQNETENPIYNK